VASAGELDDQEGPVRDRLVALQKWWIDLLADVVRAGQREGTLRATSDALDVAHELYGILLDAHHAARLLRDPGALARAHRLFDALLARHVVS
jgi:hypothetical protein